MAGAGRCWCRAESRDEMAPAAVHGLWDLLMSPSKCCLTRAEGRMRILQEARVWIPWADSSALLGHVDTWVAVASLTRGPRTQAVRLHSPHRPTCHSPTALCSGPQRLYFRSRIVALKKQIWHRQSCQESESRVALAPGQAAHGHTTGHHLSPSEGSLSLLWPLRPR